MDGGAQHKTSINKQNMNIKWKKIRLNFLIITYI